MAQITLYDDKGNPVIVETDDDTGSPTGVASGDSTQRTDAEWRELRIAKNKATTAERELAGLKRLEAFRAAGIDPNDAKQKFFVAGYDGDLAADKIKAAAVASGFLTAEGDGTSGTVDAQAQAAAAANAAAVAAGTMTPEKAQELALAAATKIANAAMGGETTPPSGVAALDEAFAKGGVEGMLVAAEKLGLTVKRTVDGQ